MQREEGFTLIELISVLLIVAIVFAVAIPKIIDLGSGGNDSIINLAIDELNSREELNWHNLKLEGYSDDADIEAEVMVRRDWDIGNGTTVSETHITVRGFSASVHREPATRIKPAVWIRN